MIDLGNKHLNEQKMVPLVARFKKYLSFIWSPLFFYYWGRILFNIKYTKLFIKSMFLMLLFWSTDKLRKLGQQTITAERAIWIFSCSLIPAENCLKICHCFGQSPSCNKKYPRLPLKLRSIKKVNPLDYPWQNQIMKTVHSETGKSIRAYAELFIQNRALF